MDGLKYFKALSDETRLRLANILLHHELKVGELVLFPEVRKTPSETIIAAPGTSCRHQIKDGTGKRAFHPVEIMWQALRK